MENEIPSSKPRIVSSNISPKSNPPCGRLFAAEKARTLFGCFRRGEANDAEVYVTAIIAILSEYSEEVVEHVTDPQTGLPRRIDFLPTVREVDAACRERRDFYKHRDVMLAKGYELDAEKMRWIKR